MLQEETLLYKQGYRYIAGVDEVGRGPLAGPVTAAAVILPIDHYHEWIRDSKTLSEKQRELMYEYIVSHAVSFHVISISHTIVDKINILEASKRAMVQALKKLSPQPDFILLDAVNINMPGIPQKAIIHGDGKVFSIAAASILAKVTRDRIMKEYHKKYPQYGFDEHVGYPTEKHVQALQKIGPCAIHRRSFRPVQQVMVDA